MSSWACGFGSFSSVTNDTVIRACPQQLQICQSNPQFHCSQFHCCKETAVIKQTYKHKLLRSVQSADKLADSRQTGPNDTNEHVDRVRITHHSCLHLNCCFYYTSTLPMSISSFVILKTNKPTYSLIYLLTYVPYQCSYYSLPSAGQTDLMF